MTERVDTLVHILNCDIPRVHPAVLSNKVVGEARLSHAQKPYAQCLQKHLPAHGPTQCLQLLHDSCRAKNIVAIKTIRIGMYAVGDILERVPDAKIIYYTRDPRGTMNSRRKMRPKTFQTTRNLLLEAQSLCRILKRDYGYYMYYSSLYPGRVRHFRYEDLAEKPLEEAQLIYEFIGKQAPQSLHKLVNNITKATGTDTGFHGSVYSFTRNSVETMKAWQTELKVKEIHYLTMMCKETLMLLGYSVKAPVQT